MQLQQLTHNSGRLKAKLRGRETRCNCSNFTLSVTSWRKNSNWKEWLRQLTPYCERYETVVKPKMSRSQTARGSCARSWHKLVAYLLAQLAVVSWGRLSSRLRLAVSWVVKVFAKDPKSWRQMDPSWRWPVLQRRRKNVGSSSSEWRKPSWKSR